MYRLTLDMHPELNSRLFHGHRCGIAVCWCATDDLALAEDQAFDEMHSEGFIVNDIFEIVEATPNTPRDAHERRSYDNALRKGFFARIDLGRRFHVNRERVCGQDEVDLPLQTLFVDYCLALRRQGRGYLLYSVEEDIYWTTKIIEQPVLPIWSTRKGAVAWGQALKAEVSGIRETTTVEIVELLEEAYAMDEEIAVPAGDVMITFHPMAVLELLGQTPRATNSDGA